MISKMFEVRDRGTRIQVIAILTKPEELKEKVFWRDEGFGENDIILVRCEKQEAHYDPFAWEDHRTLRTAHLYIRSHFDELPNFSVVDVRHILNETKEPADTELWSPENLILYGTLKIDV